jgi:ParB family chromosome partitioning protein
MNQQAIFYLEVDKINPNPYQPRRNFDEASIKELAESVRQYGIIEPLIVSRIEKATPSGLVTEYQLIAGERRLMAAKLVGLSTVPAIIREGDEERTKLELALIENIQRKDLNPIERARAFARLSDEFGMPQREIALRLGKSREWVANTLRLLLLPQEAQKAIEEGKMTEGHGRVLLSLSDINHQKILIEKIVSNKLTVREALQEAEKISGRKIMRPRINIGLDPIDREIAHRLEEVLNTKVIVKNRPGRGEISIVFHNQEQLNSIIKKIIGDFSI